MFSAMKERKKWNYLRCWFACLTILYITVYADVCKFAKGGTKNLFAKSFQNIWNGLQSIFTQLRAEILLIPEILYLLSWGLYGTGIIWQSDCKMFISWTFKWEGRKYSLFAWPCSFVIFHLEKILSFLRMLTNTFCSKAGVHPPPVY